MKAYSLKPLDVSGADMVDLIERCNDLLAVMQEFERAFRWDEGSGDGAAYKPKPFRTVADVARECAITEIDQHRVSLENVLTSIKGRLAALEGVASVRPAHGPDSQESDELAASLGFRWDADRNIWVGRD